MAKKKDLTQVGAWAFVVGLLVAIVLGIAPGVISATTTILVLGILGIVVGLLNIGERETQSYLLGNIAFLVASGSLLSLVIAVPALGIYLATIVANIALFVAPGAAIVGLKAIYQIAR